MYFDVYFIYLCDMIIYLTYVLKYVFKYFPYYTTRKTVNKIFFEFFIEDMVLHTISLYIPFFISLRTLREIRIYKFNHINE